MDNYEAGFIGWDSTPIAKKEPKSLEEQNLETEKRGITRVLLKEGSKLELNKVYCMDCREGLKMLDSDSLDSCVTDPPYELGFMGKSWDKSGIAYDVKMWGEVLRVLKPGAHLLAFGGSRTYHRMACAIEDAGFEVRDMVEWVYGSGFPKSLNIGKAIDKIQGNEREHIATINKCHISTKNSNEGWKRPSHYNEDGSPKTIREITKGFSDWEGWGTALKPAHEPVCMARKPLSEDTIAENVLKWGTGGINIDQSRIACGSEHMRGTVGPKIEETDWKNNSGFGKEFKATDSPLGRFPANLIHDGSPEVLQIFPETESKPHTHNHKQETSVYGNGKGLGIRCGDSLFDDSGSAARFFYCAKASRSERNEGCEGLPLGEAPGSKRSKPADGRQNPLGNPRANNHPTVKPIALMEYLIKLVTPSGGVVLDPFMGSGSTAYAAKYGGMRFIGFELIQEYCEIINKRTAQKVLWEVTE